MISNKTYLNFNYNKYNDVIKIVNKLNKSLIDIRREILEITEIDYPFSLQDHVDFIQN